ncbi:MAG: hypothetical protein ABI831_26975 [Betaproteobacteria bacterium]
MHNLTERLPESARYTHVFEGNSEALDHILVSGALSAAANYDIVHVNSEYVTQVSDHDAPVARLEFDPQCVLDLDGNANLDPLTDGIMLIRAMSGLSGTAVTNGAIGPLANRTTWEQIEPYYSQIALDIDGNHTTDAMTDGLLILRAMFGFKGAALTVNATGGNATRDTWEAVRTYLNTSCGTSYTP